MKEQLAGTRRTQPINFYLREMEDCSAKCFETQKPACVPVYLREWGWKASSHQHILFRVSTVPCPALGGGFGGTVHKKSSLNQQESLTWEDTESQRSWDISEVMGLYPRELRVLPSVLRLCVVSFSFSLLIFFFETGSLAAQAGPKLSTSLRTTLNYLSFCLCLPRTGITGVYP